jgi:hypothetical protein
MIAPFTNRVISRTIEICAGKSKLKGRLVPETHAITKYAGFQYGKNQRIMKPNVIEITK